MKVSSNSSPSAQTSTKISWDYLRCERRGQLCAFRVGKLYSELKRSTGGAPIATGLSDWIAKNVQPAQAAAYEREALAAATQYLDLAQQDRAKLSDALIEWIPEVARYSFREVRL